MRSFMVVGLVLATLAGCDQSRNDNLFRYENAYYAPKISVDRGDRSTFTVSVRGFEQGLDGAREAARYEATKHCINYLGSSDAMWTVGPDSDREQLKIVSGALVFSGKCDP
ncbi:MAG: hypothetical protein P8Q92_03050 [Pseudoprimorskyibacter sp.]|jgi:hypothetical protein|nr:hypothetical protein [Pseudoprimorskyibacter sp.]